MSDDRAAFIWDDVRGQEIEVDQVRFGLGTREFGLQSSEWLATTAHGKSNDLFVATKGLSRDIKVTFHERDAIVGFLAERSDEHRQRGLLGPNESRQRSIVPIPGDGAWEAAHIDFVHGALLPSSRARPLRPGKPITLVAPPKPEHLTRIFIVHSRGAPGRIVLEGLEPDPIAGLRKGDRFLRFFAADIPIDVERERAKLQGFIRQIPDFEGGKEITERGDLAAVLWGDDGTRLNFCEVHNIEVARPAGVADDNMEKQ